MDAFDTLSQTKAHMKNIFLYTYLYGMRQRAYVELAGTVMQTRLKGVKTLTGHASY